MCIRDRVIRFVNKNVYGDRDDSNWWASGPRWDPSPLWSRYWDWAGAALIEDHPMDFYHEKFQSRLPDPFNKGNDWFHEAIEAIKADVTQFEDIEEWKSFWSPYKVFQNNKEVFDNFIEELPWDTFSYGFMLLD